MRGPRPAAAVALLFVAAAAAAAAAAADAAPDNNDLHPPPLLTLFGPLRLGADAAADDRTLSALGTWLRLGGGGRGDDASPTTTNPWAWPAPPPPPRADAATPSPPDVIFFSDDDVTCGKVADLWFSGSGGGGGLEDGDDGAASTHHPPPPHVRCVDTCVHDDYPRLNMSCVIAQAVDMARTPLVCLINSDIALGDDFVRAAERLFFGAPHPHPPEPGVELAPPSAATNATPSEPNPRLLMVGRRTDVQLAHGRLDFSDPAWAAHLRDRAAASGGLHSTYGVDYLLTATAGFWNARGSSPPALAMPPFLVGVYRWDSWTMASAIAHPDVAVVDATAAVTAFHLQGAAVGREPAHAKRAGSVYADRLVRGLIGSRYLSGHTGNAAYELGADGRLVARF